MKKTLKKFLVTLLTAAMVFSSLAITAAADEDDGYTLFIGFGADAAESGDWGYGYAGPDSDVAGDVTATVETIKVGETKTVSITLPSECVYTWWLAPVLLAENVTDLDATVSVSVDGKDVTGDVDFAAGDAWWYEGTGNYDETQAIRLAGGYNEWGTQYMSSPVFTTIEYTVTLNSITTGEAAAAVELTEATDDYDVFLAIGADAAESGDWGYGYYGPDGDNAGDVVATNATITSGGTATVSLEFPSPVVYTWFVRPVICATDIAEADFSVQVLIDGEDVTDSIDFAAGDNWWMEDTGNYNTANGNQPVCVAGGYNEWGTKYMAESPAGFSKIEFVITANSMMVGGAADAGAEEEATSAAGAVDLDGTYHAYLGFQTPKYSFRNAFDDASYGRDTSDVFNQVTGWDSENNAVTLPGTFTDVEIAGNGTYTVSVDGLEFPDGEFDSQEYMNLIFLSTDIPNTNEITISDVELKVDGKSVDLASAGAIVSPDSVDYLNILLQNIWNDDVSTIGYYNVPMSSLSITFTVSGFNYDNTAATEAPAEDTEAPAADTETSADTTEKSSNTGLIVGIVVAVVVVAGVVVGVVVSKKKKAK